MTMAMPKCPYCSEELEYEEKLNAVCCDTDYYYETWLVFCPKCEREFKWDENYNFVGYDNFEELGGR
jgi:endogenous inhibitor of DNA gyrase (YacG/DUF329 family)